MNTFVRVTAFGLISLGVLVMLGGLAGGILGMLRSSLHLARFGGAGLSLLLGFFIFIQGALVSAAGQILYLLAGISREGLPTHSV